MSQQIDHEGLVKTVDFMLFRDQDGRLDKPQVDKLRSAGQSPQFWADIVADELESFGGPLMKDAADRLRNGETNKHVAARLGYV